MPALHRVLADQGQVVALVKPQFEAGREQIGKNGIIRDAKIHQNVLESVTAMAVEAGFSVLGLDFSPIQGGHGNIEFLAYLKKEKSASNQILAEIKEAVERAHSQFKNE
ncbi:hemolysin A [Streptococcus pneumoniae]|nr:hemolysin A [Streptococcus pneumoniae]